MTVSPSAATASHAWCTYFDSAYMARGIAMLRSLRLHDPAARILVLALDELCARVLRGRFGSDLTVIETESLHAAIPELRAIRSQRSPWAYYATQKAAWLQFAMERAPRPESIVCIDADTWFFSDPSLMFAEIGAASVAIAPHRFPPSLQHSVIYGKYNAGCIYWRDDETGRRCLADWRDDCLSWCSEETLPDGRFMNQGYLNRWPERYQGVHILSHPGADLAPWNVDAHLLERDGGGVAVDGRPLIFFHFSGLSRDLEGHWQSHYPRFDPQFDLVCEAVYNPYLLAVEAESRGLKEAYGIEGMGSVRSTSKWYSYFQFEPHREPAAPRKPPEEAEASERSSLVRWGNTEKPSAATGS